MKKILLVLTAGTLLFCSCNSNSGTGTARNTDSVPEAVRDTPVDDGHNAENSLDIAGSYKGLLPCADCEGVETILALNNDQSFTLKEAYKGKKEAMVSEMKGKWVIHENIITLQFSKEVQDRVLQYRAEEGRLRTLDQQGKIIEGSLADHYLLQKQAN